MWRPNYQIHLFSQQTERELYPRHWSTVEQANGMIGFQNGELDFQQSNIPGVNLFPNGLQHVPRSNSSFYEQQMAQVPPSIASNFGSQIVNHGFPFLSVFNESAMKGVKRKGEDDYKYVY